MPNCRQYIGIVFGEESCRLMQQKERSLCSTCPEPNLAAAREKLKSFDTARTEKEEKILPLEGKQGMAMGHRFGHQALTPDTLTPGTVTVPETIIILDQKLIRLVALIQKDLLDTIRLQAELLDDFGARIAELEAERDAIGRMAGRLARC